jgi:hypothetical protein
MKNLIPRIFLSGSIWVTFALAGLFALQNSHAQTPPAPVATETVAQAASAVIAPPNILPTSPLAQVIRLTQAGVDQSVIMNYITGSASTFNLDSEKIIYLSNLGVPTELVNAMMQRDQQLQQQFASVRAAQQAPPAQPPQPAPETAQVNLVEAPAQTEVQPAPVTVDYFNTTLSPYGNWVVVNGYGRCWQPTAVVYNSSWQPYCDRGHWVYSDCGWYWASDYAWGATFHYGRWFRDANYGWCWYPDTVWAPSWVTWRYSDDYCGWAPLPPRTSYQAGVGIVYNGSGISAGFSFGLGASCFTFVPTQYFCNSHPRNYCAAPAQVTQIYNKTKIINNIKVTGSGNNQIIVNNGIAVQNIASATRTAIHPVPVHELNNNHVAYRRADYNQGTTRPTFTGNPSSQPLTAAHNNNYFPQTTVNQNPQPAHNWTAPQTTQPEGHHTVTTIPETTVPEHVTPTHEPPVQTPPAHYYQQQPNQQPSVPARWQDSQSSGTPRNSERNSEAHQIYSAPASQSTEPVSASVPSQRQAGGGHNGNQWGP